MTLPGGFTKLDPAANDAGLAAALAAVETNLASKLGGPLSAEIVRDTAEAQVVAGTNYRFSVAVKDAHVNTKVYQAQVWGVRFNIKRWRAVKLPAHGGGAEVTHLEEQAPEPGSPRKVSPTNYEVDDAAAYAVQRLSETSNSLFPYQLKEVVSAEQRREADGSVSHALKLKVSQGNMPDQQFDAVVVDDGSGYVLQSSDVVMAR